MKPNTDGQIIALLLIAGLVALVCYRRRWRGSGTAYGTAAWMTDKALQAAGMLAGRGLILGRTFKGALIRLPDYCHVLLCGGTGFAETIRRMHQRMKLTPITVPITNFSTSFSSKRRRVGELLG